jgi:hypothetical protein
MKLMPIFYLFLICCFCSVSAGQTNNLIAHVSWPRSDTAVICEVHELFPTNSNDLPTRELSFIDSHGKRTIAIKTPDSFLSMYPIGDEDALFMTVWVGGSAYHISVFTWKDNQPNCVLESGSKTFPEIVFDVTKSSNTFFFLNDCPGGPNNPANWITICYRWDGKKMILLKKVPAKIRFKILN